MKPFSIVLSLVLGLAALCLIVWVGRFGAPLPVTRGPELPSTKAEATVDDLPVPDSGPLGQAEVSEREFKFGTKNVGDTDEHVFTIKNVGKGTLEFKMGKPTCQCTVGEITRDGGEVIQEGPLAPGESINILVKWVMKTQMEHFRQVVPVITTDPDQRTIELVIVGAVDQPLHLSPEGMWDFGDMSTTQPSIAEGYVGSAVLDAFTLSEEPRDNSRVKVTWEPAESEKLARYQAKSGYLIKVEVGPDVPIGLFREAIRLKATASTGDMFVDFIVGGRRSGPIEIRGVVGANFNVESNRLLFGEFPASSGKKAKLTFIVKDLDEELVLKSVEPAESHVKFKFPETGKVFGKSKSYQVEIEIPPGPPAKRREANAEVLNLKFNHPAAPDLKLTIDYHAK